MALEEIREDGVVVLVPDGSLSQPRDCNDLVKALAGVLEGKENLLVLDCQEVDQLGAAGLRVLLRAKNKLKSGGGRVFLCNMNADVQRALDISGFDRQFEIAATRAEAVKRAKAPREAPSEQASRAEAPQDEAPAGDEAGLPTQAAQGPPLAVLVVEALRVSLGPATREPVPADVVKVAMGALAPR